MYHFDANIMPGDRILLYVGFYKTIEDTIEDQKLVKVKLTAIR